MSGQVRKTKFVSDAAMEESAKAVQRLLATMARADVDLLVELADLRVYDILGKRISVKGLIRDFNGMATKTGVPEVTFELPVPGIGNIGTGFENIGGEVRAMSSSMTHVRVTLRMDHFRDKINDSPIYIKTMYPVP
jgi:hypothetical protein